MNIKPNYMDINEHIYKFEECENGNIILHKLSVIILNKQKSIFYNGTPYIIQKLDNDKLILKKSIIDIYISNIDDLDIYLNSYDFKRSTIEKINSKKLILTTETYKYAKLLYDIYTFIGDGTTIIKKTKLNIKTIKRLDSGFRYIEDLGISVQSANANKTFQEICIQCLYNSIDLYILIHTSYMEYPYINIHISPISNQYTQIELSDDDSINSD